MYQLHDNLIFENLNFKLNNKRNNRNSLKYMDKKCSHCAMRPVYIGKQAYCKEISDMLDIGRKPSQVMSVVVDINNILKSHRVRCSNCAMALDDSFRWLSTIATQSIAIARNDRTVSTILYTCTRHRPERHSHLNRCHCRNVLLYFTMPGQQRL